jgi:hypothetical protein
VCRAGVWHIAHLHDGAGLEASSRHTVYMVLQPCNAHTRVPQNGHSFPTLIALARWNPLVQYTARVFLHDCPLHVLLRASRNYYNVVRRESATTRHACPGVARRRRRPLARRRQYRSYYKFYIRGFYRQASCLIKACLDHF